MLNQNEMGLVCPFCHYTTLLVADEETKEMGFSCNNNDCERVVAFVPACLYAIATTLKSIERKMPDGAR